MKYLLLLFFAIALLFQSCIGDDILQDEVAPVIRINNPLDTMAVNTTYQFEYSYFDNVGKEQAVDAVWSSSNPTIIEIDANGLAEALGSGASDIAITYISGSQTLTDLKTVIVGQTTTMTNDQRSGTIVSTSSYQLEGDFTLEKDALGDLVLSFAENYKASTSLPGLYIYLTNNPSSSSGAHEIGPVDIFSGAHSYNIGSTIDLFDYSHVLYYCKPFNVKVGDGEIN